MLIKKVKRVALLATTITTLHKGTRTTFSNLIFAWNTQNIFIQQTMYLILQKTKFPVLKQNQVQGNEYQKEKYWNQDMKQEENSIMS